MSGLDARWCRPSGQPAGIAFGLLGDVTGTAAGDGSGSKAGFPGHSPQAQEALDDQQCPRSYEAPHSDSIMPVFVKQIRRQLGQI
jgi:hypothetical protein